MIISKRELEILSMINGSRGITLKTLVDKFQVSERTVRYNLENLDYILKNIDYPRIQMSRKGDIKLNLNFSQYNFIIENFCGMFEVYRLFYLKIKLLTNEIVNLTKEADEVGVSRGTLKKDMDTIKVWIKEKYSLDLVSDNKGVRIQGDEENIREFFFRELLFFFTKDRIVQLISRIGVAKSIEAYFDNIPLENRERFIGFSMTKKEKDEIQETLIFDKRNIHCEVESKVRDILMAIRRKFEFGFDLGQEMIDVATQEALYPSKELFSHPKMKESRVYKALKEEIERVGLKTLSPGNVSYLLYLFFSGETKKLFYKLKILIISDSNDFLNNLICEKLKEKYHFEKIDTTPLFLYEIYGVERDYDAIFTCENVSEVINSPILKINKILEEIDFIKIELFFLDKCKNPR